MGLIHIWRQATPPANGHAISTKPSGVTKGAIATASAWTASLTFFWNNAISSQKEFRERSSAFKHNSSKDPLLKLYESGFNSSPKRHQTYIAQTCRTDTSNVEVFVFQIPYQTIKNRDFYEQKIVSQKSPCFFARRPAFPIAFTQSFSR